MFIVLIKCCFLLRLNETMATAVSTMMVIFSSLLWPLVHTHSHWEHTDLNEVVQPAWFFAFWFQVIGVILVFAFSTLGNLVTLPKSVYSVITHGFGSGKLGDLHKNQASWTLCCYGALICIVSFALKAMVRGCVESSLKEYSPLWIICINTPSNCFFHLHWCLTGSWCSRFSREKGKA